MTPTIYEAIFWTIAGILSLVAIVGILTINPNYDPKGDDPYRYCPKEEEK